MRQKSLALLVVLVGCAKAIKTPQTQPADITYLAYQATCHTKEDCPQPSFSKCEANICEHKDVWPPSSLELIGIVVLPVLLGLANIGGIGGGGLIIPLCIMLFGMSTKQAIALSNTTIAIGAIIRYFGFSIHSRHPHKPVTIVDYNMAAIMTPLMMIGSFVSVIFAQVMPDAVLTILIAVLMLYLTVDTGLKAIKMWRQEQQQQSNAASQKAPLSL